MIKSLLLVAALLFANSAFADLRLLIRFDESGHHLHRLFTVAPREILSKASTMQDTSARSNKSQPITEATPIARGRSVATASADPTPGRSVQGIDGFVRLVWEDSSGLQLAQTLLPDPRVVHSPTHITGVQASRAALTSGAWLATGPAEANSVTILLPESLPLGLSAETWILPLNSN